MKMVVYEMSINSLFTLIDTTTVPGEGSALVGGLGQVLASALGISSSHIVPRRPR